MAYLAKWDGGSIFLSRDEQMEQYLEKGAEIYREENGAETLIATPQNGFLVERPTFPESATSTSPAASEYAIAGKILLGLED